jgi:hypothetical protein
MDRCKLCGKELDPMEGRLMIPDFHYRSRHLRLKHNIDISIENMADYFKIVDDRKGGSNRRGSVGNDKVP